MSLNYFGQAFKLAFQVSPILLVDGLAKNIPGGILPIATFTEGLNVVDGLLHGDVGFNASSAWMPSGGTTLIQQDIGTFNFYNQATAANSVVNKPNRIMMQMTCPVSTHGGGFAAKSLAFTGLKLALDRHNQSGGYYTVMTPAFIYTGCLLRSVADVSGFSEQNKQVQHTWAFEFEQPLLQISQLDAVLGNLMNKFESGMPAPFQADTITWSGNGDLIPAVPTL